MAPRAKPNRIREPTNLTFDPGLKAWALSLCQKQNTRLAAYVERLMLEDKARIEKVLSEHGIPSPHDKNQPAKKPSETSGSSGESQ